MKRLLYAAAIVAALIIGVLAVRANGEPKKQERATVEFTETVKLRNVFLKGEYFIIHDDDRMAKGEPCIYVFDRSGKIIVSFHCTPVERPRAKCFRVVTSRLNLGNGPAE